MEYGWKCLVGKGLEGMTGRTCAAARLAFIFALLLLLTLAAASFSYAAEALTLEQAVAKALDNNPALKAAGAQIETADAGLLRSTSAFLPRVTLSEIWSRTDSPLMAFGTKLNREIVTPADFDPSVMNNPEAISNYDTRLTVMQPVWSGGKEYIGRKQAGLAKEASIQDRARARQETIFGVVKAYYGLLLAREYRKVALQSRETSEANVKLADARYRAGAVLQSDFLGAKVQLAEVREMMTRSENAVKLGAVDYRGSAARKDLGLADERTDAATRSDSDANAAGSSHATYAGATDSGTVRRCRVDEPDRSRSGRHAALCRLQHG